MSRGEAVQRIVGALLAVGWGPELEDRESITNNSLIREKDLADFREVDDPGWSTARRPCFVAGPHAA